MTTTLPIKIRRATDDDLSFFFSATLQSHYYSAPANRYMLPSIYYAEHKKVLCRLLESCPLLIACDQDSPEIIMGFALFGPKTAHYVYVKRPFRKFGIARMLLAEIGIGLDDCTVTHWTEDLTEIWRSKRYPGLVYNPYLLRE